MLALPRLAQRWVEAGVSFGCDILKFLENLCLREFEFHSASLLPKLVMSIHFLEGTQLKNDTLEVLQVAHIYDVNLKCQFRV